MKIDIDIKTPGEHIAKAATDFLQKLIGPAVDEVGGLLADQVRLVRFKNQVNILMRAEEYMKRKNIETKNIPLKVLAPLLEGCSLEEEESLKDKWVALLVNTAQKGGDNDNPLYSYLLSQMSSADAKWFDMIFKVLTTTHENNNSKITAYGGGSVKMQFSQHDYGNSKVSMDNLLRLRLIKETQSSIDNSPLMLTDLGFRFATLCTLS